VVGASGGGGGRTGGGRAACAYVIACAALSPRAATHITRCCAKAMRAWDETAGVVVMAVRAGGVTRVRAARLSRMPRACCTRACVSRVIIIKHHAAHAQTSAPLQRTTLPACALQAGTL